MSIPIEIGAARQFDDLGYDAPPAELQGCYNNAFFIGRNFDLSRLALIAGLKVSASGDGTLITWHNTDEISLRLAPTPDGSPGVWISGIPFISEYEGEDGNSRSKLLGEEGDLIVAGNNQIVIISKEGTNPKNMCKPNTDTPIPSINTRIIDAYGHLRETKLPKRQIRDIFKEMDDGVAPYPDY